ncbi:MAG: MAPEG family protein [Stappiaceae bacterium]
MQDDTARKARFKWIILCYPLALIVIATLLNMFVFGVSPAVVALPAENLVIALSICAVLLVINHTWLMNSTELTRLDFDLKATPEEWANSDVKPDEIAKKGWAELERRHNAHRNATENTAHFILLALTVCLVSPTHLTAQIWIVLFAVGRLGHTFSYLSGKDSLRGLFMSLSLAGLYGLASYLMMSFLV